MKKSSIIVVTVLAIMSVLAIVPIARANGTDYFVYSHLDTGVMGSYGVDGYVGADGIHRIIFYSGSTAYIYTVTIPDGADPNMHPDNPEAPGPVAPRTFTLERTFDLGVSPGHEAEFYVDAKNNVIYLGASVGIRKYVWDDTVGNYVYDSTVAPPSPMEEGYSTQSLAYDPANDTWYAGSIAWNANPGVTLRDMWKYTGTWELAFQYTTPEGTDPMTHHDGLEFINGYLFLADYVGDYIKQYTTDGTLVNVFWHQPLGHELEGMGFGALGHFWCGSHGSTITEFGGGRLQEVVVELCPDEYRWSIHHTPPYEWDPFPMLFRNWTDVHFVNSGSGDAYNVTATITCAPGNVNIVDGDVTLGDIPAGSGAWSQDFFMLEVDMTNPQDPNKGICWRVEYDDAAGVHHVIEDVAKYCGEKCSDICP